MYPSDADTDDAASPAKWFHFILADEWRPTRGKLVRKVVFPQRLQNSQALLEQILRPERHGFMPRNPGSLVTLGRHVLGMTDSRFISSSNSRFGSPRFEGRRYWIDEQSLRASGATVHDAAAIVADLDRIAAKNANRPAFQQYIEDIKHKSLVADWEAVIEGAVPPGAVKGATDGRHPAAYNSCKASVSSSRCTISNRRAFVRWTRGPRGRSRRRPCGKPADGAARCWG